MGRLFCLGASFLLALAPAACIRAYPKTVGALEISARRSDGPTFATRGPITFGGFLGCEGPEQVFIDLSLRSEGRDAGIRLSGGHRTEPWNRMELWADPLLLGNDDQEHIESSNPVFSIVATPLSYWRFRYSATMSGKVDPGSRPDGAQDVIESFSARAEFITTPALGRGATVTSYSLCDEPPGRSGWALSNQPSRDRR